MIDDGGSPDLFSENPNPEVVWADEQLLIPDDLFGAPPPEPAGDGPAPGTSLPVPDGIWAATAGEGAPLPEPAAAAESDDDLFGPATAAVEGDGPAFAPASSLDSPLPDGIWGATTTVVSFAQPEMADQVEFGDTVGEGPASVAPSSSEAFAVPDDVWGEAPEGAPTVDSADAAETEPDEDWWVPRDDADEPVTAVVPSLALRPKLAPLRASGASSRRRGLDVRKGVAAMALVVVAAAGLIVAMVSRGSDEKPTSASQQIDAAGVGPSSTMPTSTIPRTSTTVAAPATLAQPVPPTTEVPATSLPAPPGSSGATPVTTAAPRSPSPTAAPVTAATSPPPPTTAPAPPATPTATVAPPPPPPVVVLPDPEPEPTVTTRRPRPTVPDTTIAPSTTLPAPRIPIVVDE